MHYLTFDQDWAPDWAMRAIVERLEKAGLQGTIFVTHDSPYLATMKSQPHLELGWHPNFLPGSSHGDTVEAVLDYMASIVPEAVGARAHTLMRGTPLLLAYQSRGLSYDAADILDGKPGLDCFLSWTGMTRIPIYFEDDVHLQRDLPITLEALRLHEHGLKVMTFHPVLVALNCANLDAYNDLKRDLGDRGIPLTEASRDDFAPHVQHQTPGMGSLFEAVVTWLASRPTGGRKTLRTLP